MSPILIYMLLSALSAILLAGAVLAWFWLPITRPWRGGLAVLVGAIGLALAILLPRIFGV